jgi:hypothetical protein
MSRPLLALMKPPCRGQFHHDIAAATSRSWIEPQSQQFDQPRIRYLAPSVKHTLPKDDMTLSLRASISGARANATLPAQPRPRRFRGKAEINQPRPSPNPSKMTLRRDTQGLLPGRPSRVNRAEAHGGFVRRVQPLPNMRCRKSRPDNYGGLLRARLPRYFMVGPISSGRGDFARGLHVENDLPFRR